MVRPKGSLTAAIVAAVRALHNELAEPTKLTDDPMASRLLPLPIDGALHALSMVPRAGLFAHGAAGALLLGLPYHIELRTRAIDDALLAAIHDGASELIVLGAGLDSRAYRIGALRTVDVFEIDRLETQEYKQLRMELSTERCAKSLTYLSMDFEVDDLGTVLTHAGALRSAKKFWIWEGVTPYLTPRAMARTLATISELSPRGSRLVVTYAESAQTGAAALIKPAAEGALALVGEPLLGLISTVDFHALLEGADLRVLSDESALDWSDRYWGKRPLGLRVWERMVVAERV